MAPPSGGAISIWGYARHEAGLGLGLAADQPPQPNKLSGNKKTSEDRFVVLRKPVRQEDVEICVAIWSESGRKISESTASSVQQKHHALRHD